MMDVQQILKDAEGKYSRDAKIRRLKRELRDSWGYLRLPVIAQFLLIGPALLAVLLIRNSSLLDDAVAYYAFAAYWFLSFVAGLSLMRLHAGIGKLIVEDNQDKP